MFNTAFSVFLLALVVMTISSKELDFNIMSKSKTCPFLITTSLISFISYPTKEKIKV